MKRQNLDSLMKALEFTRVRLDKNVEQVKKNAISQKGMIDNENYLSEDKDKVQEFYNDSKERVKENNKLLEIQKAINAYLNEYKESFEEEECVSETEQEVEGDKDEVEVNPTFYRELPDEKELLEKTVKGEVKINDEHPFIYDTIFLNKLLSALEANEQYEECALVMKYLSFK